MKKERVLITVKTYPVPSRKYAELVCTAGVNEVGEWRRLYPIPFRQLHQEEKYSKFQWIETDVSKATSDRRPETYRPHGEIKLLTAPLLTDNFWQERRLSFINKVVTHRNLHELISSAHANELSLALYKPHDWIDFKHEETEREWDPEKLAKLEQERRQSDLFRTDEEVAKAFEVVRKLPYKFSYVFLDECGNERTLMIEDWEIGSLYWTCLADSGGKEEIALRKVRQKYWSNFVQKSEKYDLHLILGTTLQYHNMKALNPFVIIGVVPVLRDNRQSLF